MDVILRYAEHAFHHFLRERGRNAPQLTQLSVDYIPSTDRHRFRADFSDHSEPLFWEIDSYVLAQYRELRHGSMAERHLFYDCRSLYSRLYEDHLMQMELEPYRQNLLELSRTCADPALICQAQQMDHDVERHIRERHARPPTFVVGADFALDAETVRREMRRPDGFIEYNAQDMGRLYVLYESMAVRPEWNFGWDLADTGDRKAQDKGLKLLKEWLSPEQLAQYEKDRHFDVVGSDTGKRYRIRHGRQMNIDELDRKGRKVCGWCFLPEGALVAGDVMLAQKIALENFEKKALKTANRF